MYNSWLKAMFKGFPTNGLCIKKASTQGRHAPYCPVRWDLFIAGLHLEGAIRNMQVGDPGPCTDSTADNQSICSHPCRVLLKGRTWCLEFQLYK